MSSLYQQLDQAFKEALKDQQAVALSTLRMLRTSVRYGEVEVKRRLTEEELQTVIASQGKQRREAIAEYLKAGRTDLAKKEEEEIKVLLLNASNKEDFPVYPYAFIQVPAIARQAGIEVICEDLLGIPREAWKQTIQAMIERYSPAMILITLRNTDSLNAADYEVDRSKNGESSAYFPIEWTKG